MITKEQYHQMTTSWSNKKAHSAAEHILYNALRSKDLKIGFTPIAPHNYSKINSNNRDAWNGFKQAKTTASKLLPSFREFSPHDHHINYHARCNNLLLAEARAALIKQHQQHEAEKGKRLQELFSIEFNAEICEKLMEALQNG